MTSRIAYLTFDCVDAYSQSEWWKKVLGYRDPVDGRNEPGHSICLIESGDGYHRLLFVQVPDAKRAKNRVHLDLRPLETTRDDEMGRLVALGATVLDDRRALPGVHGGWVVLGDPEGNELCILRSADELDGSQLNL